MNEITVNPLLEKRKRALPGVTYRLPSRGIIYPPGVLAENVVDGEVVVYPMRLREELKMKSLDSIFQGSAVSETIAYCVPEVLEPNMLCPTDIDYLLTAIKKQTHGEDFIYKDVCMKIEHLVNKAEIIKEAAESEFEETERVDSQRNELDDASDFINKLNAENKKDEEGEEEEPEREFDPVLDNINNLGENSKLCEFRIPLSHFLTSAKEIDESLFEEQKVFEFNGFEIEVQPITFEAYKEISNLRLKDRPDVMGEEKYFDYIVEFANINISRRIKRVDNVTDQKMIEEFVNSLSTKERTEILDRMEKIFDWGIDFEYNLQCASCGKTKKLDMSHINPLYFFLIS